MSALGAFAFAGAGLIGWMTFNWWSGRRNEDRLAASRPGMSSPELVTAMIARGADEDIARSIINWIEPYYGRKTRPHVMDRLKDDVAIYSEDIEFFVADFFQDNGMPQPTRKQPEVLPDYHDVTLTSFAVYLTQRRATLLGRERIEA